jgi:hypothetical protein
MSVYIKNAANPFVPGGGSKEWRSNGLILNDEGLRNKARVRPLDKQVTEGYMVYAEMTGDRSLQLGGGATVMQLGSDPTRYDVWAEPRDDIEGCETPHSLEVNPFRLPHTLQSGGVTRAQKNKEKALFTAKYNEIKKANPNMTAFQVQSATKAARKK